MKKAFSLLVVFVLLFNLIICFPQKSKAVEKDDITLCPYDLYQGDADNNGEINISDAQEIQLYVAQMPTCKPEDIPDRWYTCILDTDRNGIVSVSDTTKLQRFLASLDNSVDYTQKPLYTWQQRILHQTGGLSFDKTAYFKTLPDAVSSYLSEPDAVVTDYCRGSDLDKPLSYTVTAPANAKKVYIIDCLIHSGWSDTLTNDKYSIKNLIPGREYRFYFSDADGKLLEYGQCVANDNLRMIDAESNTFNIRDIGGWKCDNGTLKYGMIFRGCELNGDTYNVVLNDEQKRLFTEKLGIRDEIDLRSNSETDGADKIIGTEDDITSSALGDSTDYIRYAVAPYSVGLNLNNDFQKALYRDMIKRISYDVSNGKPCYIHCLVGADRTGTICALIELICGVSLEDVERDYELTSFARNNTRTKTGREWQIMLNTLNDLEGDSLRDKAISFALKTGVTKNEINTLRKALINGDPSVIR